MSSNYAGTNQFLANLQLMTDSDSPSAQLFRLPLERLLDNSVYLKNFVDAFDRNVRLRLALTMSKARIGDSTNSGTAAISLAKSAGVLLIKTGSNITRIYSDNGDFARGTLGSVTTVNGCARNGNRILVVGVGGVRNEFTTDYGATWTAGGDIGATATNVVFDKTNGRFICSKSAGNTISHSTDGVSWASVATSLATDALGSVAVLAGGTAVACGADTGSATQPKFSRSTNGGVAWADASGTVADVATYDDTGWIAGRKDEAENMSAFVYHVGRRNSGADMRVARSADGNTWETLADISASALGSTFNARPRLRICENTGLMVIAAPIGGTAQCALYASLDGVTWSAPVTGIATNAWEYGLAGGRLFMGVSGDTYASIGVGI